MPSWGPHIEKQQGKAVKVGMVVIEIEIGCMNQLTKCN